MMCKLSVGLTPFAYCSFNSNICWRKRFYKVLKLGSVPTFCKCLLSPNIMSRPDGRERGKGSENQLRNLRGVLLSAWIVLQVKVSQTRMSGFNWRLVRQQEETKQKQQQAHFSANFTDSQENIYFSFHSFP